MVVSPLTKDIIVSLLLLLLLLLLLMMMMMMMILLSDGCETSLMAYPRSLGQLQEWVSGSHLSNPALVGCAGPRPLCGANYHKIPKRCHCGDQPRVLMAEWPKAYVLPEQTSRRSLETFFAEMDSVLGSNYWAAGVRPKLGAHACR